jgi:hypothetical protein
MYHRHRIARSNCVANSAEKSIGDREMAVRTSKRLVLARDERPYRMSATWCDIAACPEKGWKKRKRKEAIDGGVGTSEASAATFGGARVL